MTTRDVSVVSKTITDENWAYSLYVFELLSDIAVAGTAVYPTSVYNLKTDENGSGLVSLAVPDSSAWQYKVTLPNGSTCTFALEAGAAITLADIIATGCAETVTPPNSVYLRKDATNSPMTGELLLDGNPVEDLGATPKQYVDAADALKLTKAGDTANDLIDNPAVLVTAVATPTYDIDSTGARHVELTLDHATPVIGVTGTVTGSGFICYLIQGAAGTAVVDLSAFNFGDGDVPVVPLVAGEMIVFAANYVNGAWIGNSGGVIY